MSKPWWPILQLSRRHVARLGVVLVLIELGLVGCSYLPLPWEAPRRWVNLNAEGTFASWFSSMQLSMLALAAASCAWRDARQGLQGAWRGWLPLMAAFLYISVDEIVQLHEALGNWIGHRVSHGLFNRPVFYWVLAFAPAAAGVALYTAVFCYRRLRASRGLLGLAWLGLAVWVASIGLEALAGLGNLRFTMSDALHRTMISVEEWFEMAGATCLLVALLGYAAQEPGEEAVR